MRSNQNYISKNQSREVRPLLTKALSLFQISNAELAIDFGCGVGIEAQHLASFHSWNILAIDQDLQVLDIAKARCSKLKIEFIEQSFETITQLPTCDFFYCYHSLHFANRKNYGRLWDLIVESIAPGGMLVISVFGEKDHLVKCNDAVGINEIEIRNRLKPFAIQYFKSTFKHDENPFHQFEVIATKT